MNLLRFQPGAALALTLALFFSLTGLSRAQTETSRRDVLAFQASIDGKTKEMTIAIRNLSPEVIVFYVDSLSNPQITGSLLLPDGGGEREVLTGWAKGENPAVLRSRDGGSHKGPIIALAPQQEQQVTVNLKGWFDRYHQQEGKLPIGKSGERLVLRLAFLDLLQPGVVPGATMTAGPTLTFAAPAASPTPTQAPARTDGGSR
ncbi:MAG TPA: hypothetical protein VNQ90_16060 [Chthoniobacteraceae bacterium]|nr:hypothetical protein [Chthoniobacteraceae bacterium]